MSIPQRIRNVVAERSGGICEGCGAAQAVEMHHRKFKSRGGKDEVVNLLHLCGWGNHTGCHGVAHSGERGEELGWALPSGDLPENQPANRHVRLWDGIWRLKPDGLRVPA